MKGQPALSVEQPLPPPASSWAVELEALPEGYVDRECWALYEIRPDGTRRRHERYTTRKQADYLAAYFTDNPPTPHVPPMPPTAFEVFIDRLKLAGMLFILLGIPIIAAIWSGGSRGDRYYDDDIPGYWRPSR